MKKIVVKLAIADERVKRKAFKLVAGIDGVDSVTVDTKESKFTIIGDADPVYLTAKLRKLGYTELLSVGPAKEEKKEDKKEDKKPPADAKKENKKPEIQPVVYYEYPPYPYPYRVVSEETPNGCTIS